MTFVSTFLYFGMFAVAVLRWGLTSLAVGVLVGDLLLIAPATTDLSAWYIGQTILRDRHSSGARLVGVLSIGLRTPVDL